MTREDDARKISAARQAIKDGTPQTARGLAAEILREAPSNLDALEIEALAGISEGDDGAAEEALRSAIAVAPKRRWPYADLSRLLLRRGQPADAEAVVRAAIAADAQNPDALAMLAALLSEREEWFEAAAYFERAIACTGPHPQLQTGLGRALMRLGRLDDSRRVLEAAAVADSSGFEPFVYLAELEERSGRFDHAMRLLDRAEPIAHSLGTDIDLQRSVLLDRIGDYEAALALLDTRPELSGAALLQRGRLRERLGQHADAWSDWTRGKAMLAARNDRRYAADDVAAQAHALATFFDAERVTALPRAPLRRDVAQPIFIIGFPRSGTTLTEQILASHSAVRAGGELPFGGELREFAASLADEAVFPMGLAQADRDWPTLMRDFYLARAETLGLLRPRADFFTDKMPVNDFWLPFLRLAFPESAVILVRRHPLDVLTSVMAHDMTHGFNCGYRLEDAARHLALVDELLEQYRLAGIGATYELRYERLVADQAGETERLVAAIGLDVEPAQLRFHERTSVSPTPSYAQVGEPLNGRSIGRWRNYAAQLEAVCPLVADAMKPGGYAF
jgi:tetratricopeptide (TPR) repeat protein